MTNEPRILTEDETYRRRAERASHQGPKTVELCAIRDCPRTAHHGPFCSDHRHYGADPNLVVAAQLGPDDLATVKAQVEADAAVLTVIAMNWIARQKLVDLGIDLDALGPEIDRIRGELPGGTA